MAARPNSLPLPLRQYVNRYLIRFLDSTEAHPHPSLIDLIPSANAGHAGMGLRIISYGRLESSAPIWGSA